MEFKKLFGSHKIEAKISADKQDFFFEYTRSTGIRVRYFINYDQKNQKVLCLNKYINDYIDTEITDQEDLVPKELLGILKDIKENVCKK